MGQRHSRADANPPTPRRLVLYSEHASSLPNFEAALDAARTVRCRFDFATATSRSLVEMLEGLVKRYGRFERIALASHGPTRAPPPAVDGDECKWEIAASCIMTDPCQLIEEKGVRDVLVALGRSTIDSGCVDLLSSGVLETWACPADAWPTLKGFGSIEQETGATFAASTHALAGDPLVSAEDWTMDSDDAINIKLTYFVPRAVPPGAASLTAPVRDDGASPARAEDVQIQLEPDEQHSRFVRLPPVWQHYERGATLGRGAFASVVRATRRARSHPAIPEHVAIKVVSKARSDDLEQVSE